jgi:hypothetical protein
VNEHGALTQSWCDCPDLVSRVFKAIFLSKLSTTIKKDLQFQPTSVAFCTGTVSFKEGASGSMPTINVRAYHLNMYASTVTDYIAPSPQSLTL